MVHKRRFTGLTIGLLLLLCSIIVVSVGFGSVSMNYSIIWDTWKDILRISSSGTSGLSDADRMIIMNIRMPRIIEVAMAGSILSLVGVLMQTLTRNPLAEPYVLGISSGASAGAVAVIVLGFLSWVAPYSVYVGAFIGSFLSISLVLLLLGNDRNPIRLILIGLGISAFFSAVTTLIVYTSSNEAQVRSAMFWLVGSFSGAQWNEAIITTVTAFILLLASLSMYKDLDLLLLGRDVAGQMGMSLKTMEYSVIALGSLSVAILVSQVGVIGFVGLIVPHMVRKMIGPKHIPLLTLSFLLGAIVLSVADMISRTYFRPQEVPIGIITAFLGAPLFIYIIQMTMGGGRHD